MRLFCPFLCIYYVSILCLLFSVNFIQGGLCICFSHTHSILFSTGENQICDMTPPFFYRFNWPDFISLPSFYTESPDTLSSPRPVLNVLLIP